MEVVEHNLVVSTKLEIIHQFCEFCEEIYKTAKCCEENFPTRTYNIY